MLNTRIEERLKILNINCFEAARRAGLDRVSIYDLLHGKKASVRFRSLQKIAVALECDVEYLQGQLKVPRAGECTTIIEEIAEADVWRETSTRHPNIPVPIMPDIRFRQSHQTFFQVRGSHAEQFGIYDGWIVCVLHTDILDEYSQTIRFGDKVVVRRTKESAVEHTVREVAVSKPEGYFFADGSNSSTDDRDCVVVGPILWAIKLFN